MIDAHAHFELYRKEAPQVIGECRNELSAVVDSITEYRKAHVWRSWELLRPYFGFIQPTLGYHPNEAKRGNWDRVERVENFIREHVEETAAIGEVGLDYHYTENKRQRENQREVFRHFLELAVELDLPVVVHTPGRPSVRRLSSSRGWGLEPTSTLSQGVPGWPVRQSITAT